MVTAVCNNLLHTHQLLTAFDETVTSGQC